MNADMSPSKNPHLLLEAARVLNAAGPPYDSAAAAIAQAALQVRELADTDVRDAITGDVAALNLSGRLPGGYAEALKLLAPIDDPAKHADKDGRLHLLRALAKGQRYTALLQAKAKMPVASATIDADLEALKAEIRKDLETAFAKNPSLKEANRLFWDPDAEQVDFAQQEADLHALYKSDPEFRKLVDREVSQPKAEPAPAASESSRAEAAVVSADNGRMVNVVASDSDTNKSGQ
jgi:hypothetical protein